MRPNSNSATLNIQPELQWNCLDQTIFICLNDKVKVQICSQSLAKIEVHRHFSSSQILKEQWANKLVSRCVKPKDLKL